MIIFLLAWWHLVYQFLYPCSFPAISYIFCVLSSCAQISCKKNTSIQQVFLPFLPHVFLLSLLLYRYSHTILACLLYHVMHWYGFVPSLSCCLVAIAHKYLLDHSQSTSPFEQCKCYWEVWNYSAESWLQNHHHSFIYIHIQGS